jgi:NADH-quinone oxidoreductase subunit A
MVPIEYLPLAILFILATVLALLVVSLGHLFGPRRPTQRKAMPYESGMRPIGPGTRRTPVRFYLTAVLFILFDIEVVFFLPWAVVFRDLGIVGFVEMTIFILVLLVGLVYAWKKGALEWE